MVMQRRRISAGIVTNPSTSERNHSNPYYDSESLSHSGLKYSSRSSTAEKQDTPPSSRDANQMSIRVAAQAHSLPSQESAAWQTVPSESELSSQDEAAHCRSWHPAQQFHLGIKHEETLHNESHLQKLYPTPGEEDADRLSFSCSATQTDRHLSFPSQDSISIAGRADPTLSTSRTSPTAADNDSRPSYAPRLNKESAKQHSYVDSLVDLATLITHSLWPCADITSSREVGRSVRSISYFITETCRKSKTSLSTMQLALLYCIRFKRDQITLANAIAKLSGQSDQIYEGIDASVGSSCARRNFLSALILASKYLQDRNFSNKAWSKISSVSVSEINLREREFLEITKWNLDVKHDIFKRWSSTMEQLINEVRDNSVFGYADASDAKLRCLIQQMVALPEKRMNDFLVADMSGQAVEQLLTPLSTPREETSEFVLHVVPTLSSHSSDGLLGDALGMTETPVEVKSGTCPFFDEYIKSTPCESPLCARGSVRMTVIKAPEDNYATPESLRLASPTVSELENECPRSRAMSHPDYLATMACTTSQTGPISPLSDIHHETCGGQKRSAGHAQLDHHDGDGLASHKKSMLAF